MDDDISVRSVRVRLGDERRGEQQDRSPISIKKTYFDFSNQDDAIDVLNHELLGSKSLPSVRVEHQQDQDQQPSDDEKSPQKKDFEDEYRIISISKKKLSPSNRTSRIHALSRSQSYRTPNKSEKKCASLFNSFKQCL
jgi:hypothetical protein